MAMTYHIFQEPEPGVVAHTAATKALVQAPFLNQYIGMWLEEVGCQAVTSLELHWARPWSLRLTRILDGGCDDQVAGVAGAKSNG